MRGRGAGAEGAWRGGQISAPAPHLTRLACPCYPELRPLCHQTVLFVELCRIVSPLPPDCRTNFHRLVSMSREPPSERTPTQKAAKQRSSAPCLDFGTKARARQDKAKDSQRVCWRDSFKPRNAEWQPAPWPAPSAFPLPVTRFAAVGVTPPPPVPRFFGRSLLRCCGRGRGSGGSIDRGQPFPGDELSTRSVHAAAGRGRAGPARATARSAA